MSFLFSYFATKSCIVGINVNAEYQRGDRRGDDVEMRNAGNTGGNAQETTTGEGGLTEKETRPYEKYSPQTFAGEPPFPAQSLIQIQFRTRATQLPYSANTPDDSKEQPQADCL